MLVKINWNPSSVDLRKFGATIIVGFGLISLILLWRGAAEIAKPLFLGALAIGVLALIVPYLSKPFYWAWMGIAFVMGTIVSTLILMLIFYLIFTPIGLLMRLFGRDCLRLKKSSFKGGTYWLKHDDIRKKDYYDRLF